MAGLACQNSLVVTPLAKSMARVVVDHNLIVLLYFDCDRGDRPRRSLHWQRSPVAGQSGNQVAFSDFFYFLFNPASRQPQLVRPAMASAPLLSGTAGWRL